MATKEEQSRIGKSNVRSAKVHERRIAELLTEWSGKLFRRRRVEGRGLDVRVVEGVSDVIPVEGDIYFAIEAKKGKDFSLDALLASPHTNKFTKWWHQATFDAQLLTEKSGVKRYPFLMFKPVPAWDWIAVPQAAFQFLRPKYDPNTTDSKSYSRFEAAIAEQTIWFQHIAYDEYWYIGPVTADVSHSKKNPVLVALELPPLYFCRWRDFAANVDPASFFIQS